MTDHMRRARSGRDASEFEARGAAAREAVGPSVRAEECEVCGSRMYGLHCKLVCPNCGYRRDCSDP